MPRVSRIVKKILVFNERIGTLIRHPVFAGLTVVGNATILTGAFGLYYLEHGKNPRIQSLLDTIWWSVATVTTVGYGDISPITTPGKILGIFMMIFGVALFWSFTALFAAILVTPELSRVEKDIERVEKEVAADEKEIHKIIQDLENNFSLLKSIQKEK